MWWQYRARPSQSPPEETDISPRDREPTARTVWERLPAAALLVMLAPALLLLALLAGMEAALSGRLWDRSDALHGPKPGSFLGLPSQRRD